MSREYNIYDAISDIVITYITITNWINEYGALSTVFMLLGLILIVQIYDTLNINISMNRSTRWFLRGFIIGDLYSTHHEPLKYDSLIEASKFMSLSSNTSMTI